MIAGYIWTVPARIALWKDGDTCEAELDLGWRLFRHREAIRVLNLWCAELAEPGGPEAKAHAEQLAPPGTVVIITSKAISKTGLWSTSSQESLSRTLADIRLLDGTDFAQRMITDGYGHA